MTAPADLERSAPVEGERLRRGEWAVHSIQEHGDACRLIRAWHYSGGAPNSSTFRHGLFRSDLVLHGDAYGVAMWIPPTRSTAESIAGKDDWLGVLTLSRLVIDPGAPRNAASFLMAASIRLIPADRWPVLVTYADTAQGHTGAIYRATNWLCDGPVSAGDLWEKNGRLQGRKRGGRTLTIAEMEDAGYVRQAAAPKIRFRIDRRKSRSQR